MVLDPSVARRLPLTPGVMRIQAEMNEIHDITTEPTHETYMHLLDVAAEVCTTFSLVWRDEFSFAASSADVAADLAGYLVRDEHTDRWPGTILFGNQATVRHYRVTPASISVLKGPRGLYAWLAPVLPEDLAFYSAAGTPWLVTISHEQDAWFELDPGADVEIRRRVPGLTIVPRPT
jgi:hypothetical protein